MRLTRRTIITAPRRSVAFFARICPTPQEVMSIEARTIQRGTTPAPAGEDPPRGPRVPVPRLADAPWVREEPGAAREGHGQVRVAEEDDLRAGEVEELLVGVPRGHVDRKAKRMNSI